MTTLDATVDLAAADEPVVFTPPKAKRAGFPIYITIALIVALWTIPTLGLLVNSFRAPSDIRASGWWTALASPFDTAQWTLDNYTRVLDEGFDFTDSARDLGAVTAQVHTGLAEAFTVACETCKGRGYHVHDAPVASQAPADDAQHYMAPLTYTGTAEEAREKLLAVIGAMPRTKVVADEGNYIHATFTSLIFRFVDDVEFVIDDSAKQIHFRSAARVGYGDMGVNRKRMEEITSRFAAP